jgi:transcriptional regulator with XRE-family HTH domain
MTQTRHEDPPVPGRRRRPLLVFVGTRIRLLREERSWTQRQLAARVGVSASLLAKYESGVTEPPLRTLLRIAHALDAPLGLIAEKHGVEPARDAAILERIRQLASLGERDQQGLIAVLDIFLGLRNLVTNQGSESSAPAREGRGGPGRPG